MNRSTFLKILWWSVGLTILVVCVWWVGPGKLAKAFLEVRLLPLLSALALSALAYVGIVYSFDVLFGATGKKVAHWRVGVITFFSITVNHLVSTGGVTGAALRMAFLKKQGFRTSQVLAISIVHALLSDLVLLFFCLAGVWGWIATRGSGENGMLLTAVGILAATVFMMAGVVYSRVVRRWLVKGVWALFAFFRRFFPSWFHERRFRVFLRMMERTFRFMARSPWVVFKSLAGVFLGWGAALLALYACLIAAGMSPPLGLLLSAFVVVFLTSMVNVLPGGLGMTEGLVILVFASDYPRSTILAAMLLYRLVYFWLPLIVSYFLNAGLTGGYGLGTSKNNR